MPVYRDIVVELGSQDIAGKSNTVNVKLARKEVESEEWGSDDTDTDVGNRKDSVTIAGNFTTGATEAYEELYSLMATPSTGETVSVYPSGKVAGTKFWTGTAFCTQLDAAFATSDMGKVDSSLTIKGHLTWATYTTTGA